MSASAPLDCLVINLTRFGDLIQSQALFHDLAAHNLRAGLICQENFVKAVPLLCHVDQVWPFPGASLLRELDENWHLALNHLAGWAQDVQSQGKARMVLNLTSTTSARLLAQLLASDSRKIVGFGLDDEGFGHNHGCWSTFLAATAARRENAVFNVADMFRLMASPLFQEANPAFHGADLRAPKEADLAKARDLLTAIHNPSTSPHGFVAFQLGASSPKRQWPVASFAALGQKLWEKARICPVLTGSPAEYTLEADYALQTQTPYVSAIGKTSWTELAALMTCVQLLITNDTGTLHLASGMRTPSLSFFLATAQPWDTGPMLSHCLALEPDLPCHPCGFGEDCPHQQSCLTTIKPEQVATLVLAKLQGDSWQQALARTHELKARVWESTRDDDGLATLTPLSANACSDRTLWINAQRLFWRQFLDALTHETLTTPSYSTHFAFSAHAAKLLNAALEPALHILSALDEQGKLLGKSPQAGTLFLRNCDRLQTQLITSPSVTSLGYFWRELRSDYGQNLERLLRATRIFSLHLQALRDNLVYGTDYA